VRYTRRVTAAWAVFFMAITGVTLGFVRLRAAARLVAFCEFLRDAADGLMFVAEYAVRRRVLPQVQRRGILAACAFISRAPAKRLSWIPSRYCPMALPTAVIAYRAGVPVTARRFLSDARRLARSCPRANTC
jgi:hypothetical protein